MIQVIHRALDILEYIAREPEEPKLLGEIAVGRLLIAMLTDDEVKNYIDKYGLPTPDEWPEAVDHNGLFKQVQKIRTQGYAVRVTAQYILGFAVAIFKGKKAVASLGVYMPENRFDKRTEELSKLLKTSAKKISKKVE